VVIGDKNLSPEKPMVEVKARTEKENRLTPLNAAAEELAARVRLELAKLNQEHEADN
jgi:hypothetical protein